MQISYTKIKWIFNFFFLHRNLHKLNKLKQLHKQSHQIDSFWLMCGNQIGIYKSFGAFFASVLFIIFGQMMNGKSLCCHLISKNRNAVIFSRIELLTVILNYLEQWTAPSEPKTFVKSQDKYKRTANSANQKHFSLVTHCECVIFLCRLSPY